jgi:ABC-2 type transport system permease protein
MKFGLLHIIRYELLRLISFPSSRNLLIIIPLITFFFLSFIYISGGVRDIPIAVIDRDQTQMSRLVTRYLDAESMLKVVLQPDSRRTAEEILGKEEAYAVVVIPRDFQKNVLSGKSSPLPAFINASSILHGNMIYSAISQVAITISAGALIERFKQSGKHFEQSMAMALPINVHLKPLYNPWYNYLYYLIPGLLTVLFFMMVFFVAARSINSECKDAGFAALFEKANHNILNLVLGKAIGIYLLSMTVFLLIIGIIFPLFGIPLFGSIWALTLLFSLAIFANIFMGMGISAIVTDQVIAMDLSFFYNSPAFVFSGFTFPIFGMPALNAFYAHLIPYTYFLTGFIKLYEMDTPLRYVYPEFQSLGIFILIGFVLSLGGLWLHIYKLKSCTR